MSELNKDKEEFEAASRFAALPRCIKCDSYHASKGKAMCSKLADEIPMEFLYAPNTCEHFSNEIPF